MANKKEEQVITGSDVGDASQVLNQDASAAIEQAKAERKVADATKPKFKVKGHVTLPLLKMAAEKTYFLRIDTKIVQSEPARNNKGELVDTSKEPPFVCKVTELESGEVAQIICPAVMTSELNKHYPDDTYVGKMFSVCRHEKAAGKNYATFSIAEVEPE